MRLVLLAETEAELDEAATWYDERRGGLGDELLSAVHSAFIVIGDLPRFPYAIAYQVYEDRVFVLGIVHGNRAPRYWIDRVG